MSSENQGPPSALVTLLVSTLTFDLPAWLGWPHPAGDTSEMANVPRGSDGLGGMRRPHDAVVSVSITCTAHPLGCLTGPQRSDGICDIIARACCFPSRISPTRSHSDLFRSWDRCAFCEVVNFFFHSSLCVDQKCTVNGNVLLLKKNVNACCICPSDSNKTHEWNSH